MKREDCISGMTVSFVHVRLNKNGAFKLKEKTGFVVDIATNDQLVCFRYGSPHQLHHDNLMPLGQLRDLRKFLVDGIAFANLYAFAAVKPLTDLLTAIRPDADLPKAVVGLSIKVKS